MNKNEQRERLKEYKPKSKAPYASIRAFSAVPIAGNTLTEAFNTKMEVNGLRFSFRNW